MRVIKGAKIVMTTRRTTGNIYKLLWGIVMGDVAFVETDNDATKIWNMHLGHLSELGMLELHKRTLLKGVCSCTVGLYKYYVLEKQCRVSFQDHATQDKWNLRLCPFLCLGAYKRELRWSFQVLCDIH